MTATNKPGLLDKLEELMKNLNLCEKALNDYLETKRLAYPRFYFVSSADLLGIFNNGVASLVHNNNGYLIIGKCCILNSNFIYRYLV